MTVVVTQNNITSPNADVTALTVGTANGLNFPDSGPLSNRNKIINGDMRIDQRNAGASITPTEWSYTVDRWNLEISQASKLAAQQNAGSVTPPTGYSHYLGIVSQSAYTPTTGDYFEIVQNIEGLNTADLAWGSASAQAITLSFWVRSSLTGTHSGSLRNSANDRSYPFNYTVSSANTWEQKSLTIAGDTSGTWLSTNGVGIAVGFSLGGGTTYRGTSGAWVASDKRAGVTGAVSVVATNGATFYITGVQLEAGTVATPFERRSFGQELALCQRYYEKSYDTATAVGTNTLVGAWVSVNINAVDFYDFGNCPFRVTKRDTPSIYMWSSNGIVGQFYNFTAGGNTGNSGARYVGNNGCSFWSVNSAMSPNNCAIATHWAASAEL